MSLGITTGMALAGALYLWRNYAHEDEREDQEAAMGENESPNAELPTVTRTETVRERESRNVPVPSVGPNTEHSAYFVSSNGRKPKATISISASALFDSHFCKYLCQCSMVLHVVEFLIILTFSWI